MLRSERYAGFLRVDRAAHGLEHDRFLAEQIGDEFRAVVIVDAEYLQHAGVGQEGAGAALVERAELVNILQDRPELDAVAGHQAHRPLDGFEAAERGELIEQEQHGAGRGGRRARQIGQPLREHQAQPAGIGGEPIGRQHQIGVTSRFVRQTTI